jgi:hypothetical protein
MATATATGVQPDLEKTISKRSHTNVPPEELLASEADAELLGKWPEFPINLKKIINQKIQPS